GAAAAEDWRLPGAGVGGPGAVDAQVGALEVVARIPDHAVRGRAARIVERLDPGQEIGTVRALEALEAVLAGRRVQRNGVAAAVHRLPAQTDQVVGDVLRRKGLAQRGLERGDARWTHAAGVIHRYDDVGRRLAAGAAGWV